MTALRIKVEVGKDEENYKYREKFPLRKFIYTIDSPSNKTIDELIRSLQEYIAQKFSYINIQIVQLMTNDGFILSKSDICSNVLQNNDHIMCIDMYKFILTYYQKFNESTIWLEIKRHDASDNKEKYIRIGLNNVSELFIRMHGTQNVTSLYLFSLHELITIANEKRKDNLIARLDDTNEEISCTNWFLETKWEYDSTLNTDLFIICNLKTASSDEVYSNKLQILLNHLRQRIEKGEITHLSDESTDNMALTDEQRQRLKQLTSKIPSPKRTGPQINTNTNKDLKIIKHECEGESSVRMAYGIANTIDTFQDPYTTNEGIFGQHFVISHIIFSKKSSVLPAILNRNRPTPIEKPTSVENLTILYQIHDGSWRECQGVAIAPIAIRGEEPKWLTDSVIDIDSDKLISFSVKGTIIIKGEPGRDSQARTRLHKSLPQPLKLKIIATDNFGKQRLLFVEQLNKPIELITRELFVKNNQSAINDLLAFTYADDCDREERIYIAMYLNKENELVIRNSNSVLITYQRKHIHIMEINAKRDRTTEVPLDQIHYTYHKNETKAIALFDVDTYILYAIRLEVSTKTSKTEETVIIPIEKIKI